MRLKTLRTASFGLLAAAAAAGCASSQAGSASGSSSASVADQAAAGKLGPALLQWSGRFKGQIQHDASSLAPTRNDASGTVILTAAGMNATRAQIDLRLPQYQDPMRLYWTIVSGACGSNALPLMTVGQFPQISMSTGAGSLDETLGMPFPTAGSYHVNIYGPNSDGRDESGVMTCASLTLGRKDRN